MNGDDKDDKKDLDEDSIFQDDYDEEPIDYDEEPIDYNLSADKFVEEDIFDDDLEFEEEDLELEDEDDFDPTLEPAPEAESRRELDHEEEWRDDDLDSQDEDYSQPWPLGLFAAGIIALLLLAAGGYGVLQQRAETQKEVRLLRAKLATTTSNTEVAENRQAQRNLQIHNEELQAQVELLQGEITGLREELIRAESEAPANPTITASPEESTVAVKPAAAAFEKASTEIKSVPPKDSPTIVEDSWFVNFGSYKSKATADSWASRLSVDAGRVAVISGEKKGTLYYRVRVLDLPSKEIAGKIALQLEQTHHLPPLWVGKQ